MLTAVHIEIIFYSLDDDEETPLKLIYSQGVPDPVIPQSPKLKPIDKPDNEDPQSIPEKSKTEDEPIKLPKKARKQITKDDSPLEKLKQLENGKLDAHFINNGRHIPNIHQHVPF